MLFGDVEGSRIEVVRHLAPFYLPQIQFLGNAKIREMQATSASSTRADQPPGSNLIFATSVLSIFLIAQLPTVRRPYVSEYQANLERGGQGAVEYA